MTSGRRDRSGCTMMSARHLRRFTLAAATVFSVAVANMSLAAQDQQYQLVRGLAVYIGVLPGGITMQHPPGGSPREPHGSGPTWGAQYHVIVAIFDNASGARVTDAEVSAAVFNASVPGKHLSGPEKILDPMQVAEGTVYGNYFNMPAPAPYRIEVEIRRGGIREAVRAAFDYRHAVVTAKPPS